MNKQELIEKLEVEINTWVKYPSDFHKGVTHAYKGALSIVEQLDDSQQSIVPQFVADYIEEKKEDFVSLSGAIRTTTGSVNEWLFENPTVTIDEINLGIFVNAWNNGYKIDSPKKWVVLGKWGYLTSFSIGKNRACGWTGNGDKYNSGAIYFSDEKTALNIAEVVEGKIEEV